MDLIDFLRQRLDEDEAAARAATPGPWSALDGGVVSHNDPADESGNGTWPVASTETTRDRADREHVARWDPARVLAEVEAKRQVLEIHDMSYDPCDAHDGDFHSVPCETVEALAQPYADHPDFDPAWLATSA